MMDIHCHMLFGVDDGPTEKEESVQMLKEAKRQGIDRIILTPHYRHAMFAYPVKVILQNFKELNTVAQKLGVKLYLGCEYHVNSHMVEYLKGGRCASLAGGHYVLAEYAFETEYSYIRETVQDLLMNGYTPIVAHVERYGCMVEKPDRAAELREMGAWIQCNADAVLGKEGFRTKGFCKKLLTKHLVDVIASDSHGIKRRANHMEECYRYVGKKYGQAYANKLMDANPKKIITKE